MNISKCAKLQEEVLAIKAVLLAVNEMALGDTVVISSRDWDALTDAITNATPEGLSCVVSRIVPA